MKSVFGDEVAVGGHWTNDPHGLRRRRITFGMVETFQPYVARGEIVPLLDEYGPPLTGFYLYYPRRHRQQLKLRALVDHIRAFQTG